MHTFQTGQKSLLTGLMTSFHPALALTLRAQVSGPGHYDLILFGLNEAGQLSDDRYTVYYNQPRSPNAEVSGRPGARGEWIFDVQPGRLPPAVRRLTLAVTTDGPGSLAELDHATVTLSAGGQDLMTYRVTGRDFQAQRAVMLLDLYDKGGWRVGAVGQGFSGGLAALITHLGGVVDDLPQPGLPGAAPPLPPLPSLPPQAPPSLQKVTLDQRGSSARISLKKGGGSDPILVNLNWDRSARPRFGFGGTGGADLDLGCMYVLNNGEMGVIQALGNRFGSERFSPYIMLDGDDRTGDVREGENLTIFRPDLVHTVLIFAFIYEGTSDFTQVGGRLRLTDPRGNEITVMLSNPDMQRTFCAIASIENIGGDIQVTKEERYFRDHQECDQNYGFGFRWSAGSK